MRGVLLSITLFALTAVNAQQFFLEWIKDRPVNVTVGPDDALYCRIEDPQGMVVYDGFGRCNITLEKATADHRGTWNMIVGTSGRVLTTLSQFHVNVLEVDAKPQVITQVEKDVDSQEVYLSCSLPTGYEVKTCKFRDPSGTVMLANPGPSEDRFVSRSGEATLRTQTAGNMCGLRITTLFESDLGLWRCGMETETGTYYGFLTVLCPWAMRDPEIAAAVISEPTLTADHAIVTGVEGFGVTMSCSVQSVIKYCYFRYQNGTVFPVGEGTSNDFMEYAGAGFDAGECSVKFKSLSARDSGRWSCHVGLPDSTADEQRDDFEVNVQQPIAVTQYRSGDDLVVEGQVYRQRTIEYCRFVRIDGFGFTQDNMPSGYWGDVILLNGRCILHVANPTILDHHPWTVVARISGQNMEVSGTTLHSLENGDFMNPPPGITAFGWFMIIFLVAAVIFGILMLLPPRNRKWTCDKACALRNSMRKTPVQEFEEPKKTPLPA